MRFVLPIFFVFCAQLFAVDANLYNSLRNAFDYTGFPEIAKSDVENIKKLAASDADAMYCMGVLAFRGLGKVERNNYEALKYFTNSSIFGNVDALAAVGYFYMEGISLKQNPENAVNYFKRALPSPLATNFLGVCHLRGFGVEKSEQKAEELFNDAIKAGNLRAKISLAMCKMGGKNRDLQLALSLLKEAANGANAIAQCNIATFYLKGAFGEKEPKQAYLWFEKSATMQYPPAQLALSKLYLEGNGTEKDANKALYWAQRAAYNGSAEAMNTAGLMLSGKISGVGLDPKLAFEYFRNSVDNGYEKALDNLGDCHFYGVGTERDFKEAARYYRRAAYKNSAYSQTMLAQIKLEGLDGRRNSREAVRWLKKAADAGYVEAQSRLGAVLLEDDSDKGNAAEAVRYLKKAADADNPEALGNLGACYAIGMGVTKNRDEAVRLLKRAAVLGNEDAARALGRLR